MDIMQYRHLLTTRLSFITLCFLSAELSFAAGEMYRYEGANGEVVIDYQIPPEFISKGYSILNKSGFVIETVAPALTEEELANLSDERRAEEYAKEQEKKDKWLLERYTDASDAILARDRQIGSIETLIVVAQSNINKLKQEETKELAFAAAAEREGKPVPDDVLKAIESIRSQIRSAELHIENQKDEQKKLNQKFESIIVRLKEIEKSKQGR